MTSLYMPPQFDCRDIALAQALLREYPLAQLVSVSAAGEPFVSPLPLETLTEGFALSGIPAENGGDEQGGDEEGGGSDMPWQLLGHLANANPQVALLNESGRALVTILGPQGYMSPSVYPDLQRVPTWNYITLHARVRVAPVTSAAEKDALLKSLIGSHEPAYAKQWRGLPERYTEAMLRAITGFVFTIEDWQLKVKINQHRPEGREALRAQCAAGSPLAQGLVAWMDRWEQRA